jgi:hypothetical protein
MDLSQTLNEGDRVQFRDGEFGRYVKWPDTVHASTLVFEMERPGTGNGGKLNMNRVVRNWRSTYHNGRLDQAEILEHSWDVICLVYTECPW